VETGAAPGAPVTSHGIGAVAHTDIKLPQQQSTPFSNPPVGVASNLPPAATAGVTANPTISRASAAAGPLASSKHVEPVSSMLGRSLSPEELQRQHIPTPPPRHASLDGTGQSPAPPQQQPTADKPTALLPSLQPSQRMVLEWQGISTWVKVGAGLAGSGPSAGGWKEALKPTNLACKQ
jgi:hypothetical protein